MDDRFIPSAVNFDLTQLTSREEEERKRSSGAPSLYQQLLRRTIFGNPTPPILSFNSRSKRSSPEVLERSGISVKKRRSCAHLTAEKVLTAPDLADDRNLNLLHWGRSNLVAIALGDTVHFWNKSAAPLTIAADDPDAGPVTSISWAPDGHRIAVGLDNSEVEVWDVAANALLATLRGLHGSRVGALAWNGDNVLTSGGADGVIVNSDVRMSGSRVAGTYRGHRQDVCGLTWCGSGRQLASGGNDDLVHVWDISMASNGYRNGNGWLHRFADHRGGGVRALAWCPSQRNLLASGGGDTDGFIRFWNTTTGTCVRSLQNFSCGTESRIL